VLGIRTGAFL